jgi:hypothetical protein
MALNNMLKVAGVTVAAVATIAITAKVIIALDERKQAKWDTRLEKALADIELALKNNPSLPHDLDGKEFQAIGLRFRARMARLLEHEASMKLVEKEIAQFIKQ